MKTKVMKEYMEEQINMESNYEQISSKASRYAKFKSIKKKIFNIAAVFLIVGIVITSNIPNELYAKIKWNIKFKEYQNRQHEYGRGTVKNAVESGYNQEVEMEYIEQDGVKAKIDSLIVTDDYFEAHINFDFAENIELNSQTFGFGFAVYDEYKNIYGIYQRLHVGEKSKEYDYNTLYFYEDIGVEYNKNNIYSAQYQDTAGIGNISATDRNIISRCKLTSTKGFPKSKKLYIRVFDLGYYMVDIDNEEHKPRGAENFSISDAEWIFEIDVLEQFYNRQTTELKLKEEIVGVEIEKLKVTEIGLIFEGRVDGSNNLIALGKDMPAEEWGQKRDKLINITDNEGNIYYPIDFGTGKSHDSLECKFDVNKNMIQNKDFVLNVSIDGNLYSSEIIEK